MRTVKFDPDQLTDPAMKAWWKQWQSDAKAATAQAIKAWHEWLAMNPRPAEFECPFQQDIWKKLKGWLLENVFNFKCAYCESPLELDRYYGDAEHFRPKGQVTFKNRGGKKTRALCLLPDGTNVPHPGYFWLAYNWRNLVPACAFCNSGKGKSDQFPTAKGYLLMKQLSAQERTVLEQELKDDVFESPNHVGWFLFGPQALDADEEPLLLNPLNPDPKRAPKAHLRYGLCGAIVPVGKSALGQNSINVFDLKRGPLATRRQEAQESLRRLYYGTLQEAKDRSQAGRRLKRALKPYRDGKKDYSTAALDYLRELMHMQEAETRSAIGDDD